MMDPGSLLIAAAPYLLAGSTVLSTVGAIMGGQQQSAALRRQADADAANAAQSRANAAAQLNQSEAEVQRTQQQTRRRVASGFNTAGASGVDPSFGSPLDVMGDVAAEGALDAAIQRWKGKAAADGQLAQAGNFDRAAANDSAAAGQAGTAGFIRAGTSLLGGLAQYGTAQLRMRGPSTATAAGGIYGGLEA